MSLVDSRSGAPLWIGLYSTKSWQGPTREALDMVERWATEYAEWQEKYGELGAGDSSVRESFLAYIEDRLHNPEDEFMDGRRVEE